MTEQNKQSDKEAFANPQMFPRNKELTKKRFVDAVGEILRTDGFSGLGVNKLAKQAMTDKKCIYKYFGGVNNLIEEYIFQNDYWINHLKKMEEIAKEYKDGDIKDLIAVILKNQFSFFNSSKEMQQIILWGITNKNDLLSSLSRTRELEGSNLLEQTDAHFKDSAVNFRAVTAILISGIYYLVLHAKSTDSTFCGVNTRSEQGMNEIQRTINQILEWAFAEAEKKTT